MRYITVQPSLTQSSVYARGRNVLYRKGGAPSLEAGLGGGAPVIDGVLGVRASVWFRRDGGWIDRVDPTTLQVVDPNANHDNTVAVRVAALWQPNDAVRVTPSILYQNSQRNDVTIYWPEYSDPIETATSAQIPRRVRNQTSSTSPRSTCRRIWAR